MEQNQSNEQSIEMGEIVQRVVRIIKKARWAMILGAVVTVVAGNFVIQFVPDKYRSEATILAAEQQISPNYVTPLSNVPLMERVQVAAREVLSQPRLLDIATQFGYVAPGDSPDAAIEAFRKNVEIDPAPPYPAFRITFTAQSAKTAHDVAQRLVDLFLERHQELESSRADVATGVIKQQLLQRQAKLDGLEGRIREYQARNAGNLPDGHQQAMEEWRRANFQLDTLNNAKDHAVERRGNLQSNLMTQLSSRLLRMQEERSTLMKKFTPAHPSVADKDQQIALLESRITEIRSGSRNSGQRSVTNPDAVIAEVETQLDANATEIQNVDRDIERQKLKIEEYRRQMNTNPAFEQELGSMTREAELLRAEITGLQGKQMDSGMAVDIAKRQEAQQFRLIDPPSLPTHPASKRRQMASLATLAAGPLLGLILTALWDFRKPTFLTDGEIRRKFGPPLVLAVPRLPTPAERRTKSIRTGLELVVGCIVIVVIAGVELYAYKTLI